MQTEVTVAKCYHCGEDCNDILPFDNKQFCCTGCKTVYEILSINSLESYYVLNKAPGRSLKQRTSERKYAFIDDEQVKTKLLSFTDGHISKVTLSIPAIHCSSCIYLLENLYRLQPGILRSNVNFLRREAAITFDSSQISLRAVVEMLASIGYAPSINLDALDGTRQQSTLSRYYLRIGIAFFCFGNMMLLSFPEYLGLDMLAESPLRRFFGYLNFALALPVMFYCAQEFFISAYTALRQRSLNMDIPIVLGIIVMFARSTYEVFSHTGAGYFDTLGSLILLMLIGRLFQNKTYETLSFERNYKSYFPVSVTVIEEGFEKTIPLTRLKTGDRLLVRNRELIPADAVLMKGTAAIDYSFVTGEGSPVARQQGDVIYAGGKQIGSVIELEVTKDVSHSYLTQLWNDSAFRKTEKENLTTLATRVSKWFTPAVIVIAIASAAFWWNKDIHLAINAFASVLIITCPCALALSSPFTLGNVLRILSNNGIYLKNAAVVEKLAAVNAIVFDKTGTLTSTKDAKIEYKGNALSDYELRLVKSLTYHSSHPLSRRLYDSMTRPEPLTADSFKEVEGSGIEGWIDENHVRIGSKKFIYASPQFATQESGFRHASKIYTSINGDIKGFFQIKNEYRKGLQRLLSELGKKFNLYVASGDNDDEKNFLKQYVPEQNLVFQQQPGDKLAFIRNLQQKGSSVMMVGDGLNDAGALQQANIGLAISDNVNNFVPACDIIADSRRFQNFGNLMQYAKDAVKVIKGSFAISLLYNLIGIYFAVQGTMSPIVAAILMPISSVTIILFTTLFSRIAAKNNGFKGFNSEEEDRANRN